MKNGVRAQFMGLAGALALILTAAIFSAACGQSEPTLESSTAEDSSNTAAGQSDADAAVATADPSAATSTSTALTSTTNSVDSSTTTASTLIPTSIPSTADDLADALTRAERMLRVDNGEMSESQLAELGRHQQLLYRHLSFHPDWVETVLGSVGEDVAPVVALNWEARENLQALLATHTIHDTMPAWRVVEPFPAPELLSYYKEAEAKTGIDWEFVAAINLVETRMGRIRGVSTAGAVGPMQFLPTTWAECCQGDPTDPRDAIVGAATYLTHRGGPDNMDKAIWGYNNSDYYVNAVKAYANVLRADERAYFGYHAWQVYFLTTEGVVLIEEGYEQESEIPIADWLAQYPETLISPSS